MVMESRNLIELAESQFHVSEDERHFLATVSTYQDIAPRTSNKARTNASEESDNLAPSQKLSAQLLAWLCTDANAVTQIPHWGVRVTNAEIEGSLNLQYAEIKFPLIFRDCLFDEAIRLDCASLSQLDLSGSLLEGSQIVDLTGRVTTTSLAATDLQIEHHVLLMDGFEAKAEVRLTGAKIGGNLACFNGKFRHSNGYALIADKAEIRQDVFLIEDFEADGEVSLFGAKIGGQLDCSNGKFRSSSAYALIVQGAEIGQDVFLTDGFEADGKVSLSGIKTGGQLHCSGGKFRYSSGYALIAEGAEIGQGVFLTDGFEADGEVSLMGAKIGGQLACSGGKFRAPQGYALAAQGAEIGQDVFLMDGFEADGEVSLVGAKIGNRLDCRASKFHNPNGLALNIQAAQIGESIILIDGFDAVGTVNYVFATARVLNDSEENWPETLYLNGFTYERLAPFAPVQAKKRLKWLRLQTFSPQPYAQLAAVLKASGHDEAATKVLIGQQDDRIKYAELHPFRRFLNRVLGVFIAHGYQSYRALYWAMGFIGVGTLLFQWGYSHPSQLITPSDVGNTSTAPTQVSPDYPAFNALIYSTDVFLPIVDLHQQSYWIPNANRGAEVSLLMLKCKQGALLRWYFWAHIICGWILTSLWVAGFTGLVRKLE
ncbi:hypothetical protein DYY88_12505 [Leptolyngbya iicbica LK]|uniref:Membrane-associated oxidoreductase n=1 Tax=Leptolyngbya iicbica LK TaxID=2294035 RepID=A0A4Q7EAN5_9CYAN|nr:hypothetical protein DYY88_12505 [Leptolyngbya sp. LK]